MIKQILGYFGYIHKSELTESYLTYELAKLIGDPSEYSIEPAQENKLFEELAQVYGLTDYLSATMARDMQRDFSSPAEQRQLVKGAFARTAYLKSKIIDVRKLTH